MTSVLTEPQRALISTISDGQKAVEQAERILETKLEVPDLGTDPVRKQNLFLLYFLDKLFLILLEELGGTWYELRFDIFSLNYIISRKKDLNNIPNP